MVFRLGLTVKIDNQRLRKVLRRPYLKGQSAVFINIVCWDDCVGWDRTLGHSHIAFGLSREVRYHLLAKNKSSDLKNRENRMHKQVFVRVQADELVLEDCVKIGALGLKFDYKPLLSEFFYIGCIHRGLGSAGCIDFAHVSHKKADIIAKLFVLRSVAHRVDTRDYSSLQVASELCKFV